MRWALSLVAAAAAVVSVAPAHAAKPVVGQPAPDFQATTFDKRKLQLSDFKGQVLVLNLWATWCAPCRRELPLLDAYYRVQQPHGLRVLAIATEGSVPDSTLKPLSKVVSFPFVHQIKGPYRVMQGVPTSYIIDRDGVVRYAQAGEFTLDSLNEVLVPLLNEPAPAQSAGAKPSR